MAFQKKCTFVTYGTLRALFIDDTVFNFLGLKNTKNRYCFFFQIIYIVKWLYNMDIK